MRPLLVVTVAVLAFLGRELASHRRRAARRVAAQRRDRGRQREAARPGRRARDADRSPERQGHLEGLRGDARRHPDPRRLDQPRPAPWPKRAARDRAAPHRGHAEEDRALHRARERAARGRRARRARGRRQADGARRSRGRGSRADALEGRRRAARPAGIGRWPHGGLHADRARDVHAAARGRRRLRHGRGRRRLRAVRPDRHAGDRSDHEQARDPGRRPVLHAREPRWHPGARARPQDAREGGGQRVDDRRPDHAGSLRAEQRQARDRRPARRDGPADDRGVHEHRRPGCRVDDRGRPGVLRGRHSRTRRGTGELDERRTARGQRPRGARADDRLPVAGLLRQLRVHPGAGADGLRVRRRLGLAVPDRATRAASAAT